MVDKLFTRLTFKILLLFFFRKNSNILVKIFDIFLHLYTELV